MAPHHQSDEEIEQAAATWVYRRDAGLSHEESVELERWLKHDARNAEALARFERTWSVLDQPRAAGNCDAIERRLAARMRRRRHMKVLMATGAAAAICLAALYFPFMGKQTANPAAVSVLLPESRILADGSVITLKSRASVSVDYTESRRSIRLEEGEAYFDVVTDSRPFVVLAGGVEFRAVGTAFSVVVAPEQVELLVSEGQVAVAHAGGGESGGKPAAEMQAELLSKTSVVTAGNRAVVPLRAGFAEAGIVTSVPLPELSERLSWRMARIEFTDIPLHKAVVVINQHSPSQIRIGERELENILVSGYFRADQTEGFVRLLAANFGIRTETDGADIVLRREP